MIMDRIFPSSQTQPKNNKSTIVDVKAFGPKVYFSNERTFLTWMNISVTISSVSALVLAYADQNVFSEAFGIMLLIISIGFCTYSLLMFQRRSNMLRNQSNSGYFDDRIGPIILAVLLAVCILMAIVLRIIDFTSRE